MKKHYSSRKDVTSSMRLSLPGCEGDRHKGIMGRHGGLGKCSLPSWMAELMVNMLGRASCKDEV
jgi:hypothetical protein